MASIEISEERGVRYLHFGSRWIQGAMRIRRPWSLELDYTRQMMMALLLRRGRRWPRNVLQIGLGAASITRFLHRHRAGAKLAVVEITPQVVRAAAQFFALPDESDRLAIEIDDGYNYMAATKRKFDLIVVDGFDAKGRAGTLDTPAFYCNCRARLTDEGLMAANLLSRRGGAAESVGRIREAFDDRVLALPCEAGNTVALAATAMPIRISFGELRMRACKLKADTGVDLSRTVARLEREHDGAEELTL